MIANIENTTKSVSGEKDKEAKQTSKNKESAEKRIDRFSELLYVAVMLSSVRMPPKGVRSCIRVQ